MSEKEHFSKCIGMSRQELWEMLDANPADAFQYLGGDGYDEAALYNRAMDEVNKRDLKLADRVRQRTTPYKYANTIVRAEFSSPNAVLDGTPGGNDESNVKVA
jgi:protein-disulfide isomerase